MAEAVVHPDARRRGIGSALIRHRSRRGRGRRAHLGARQPRARRGQRPPPWASTSLGSCCRCAARCTDLPQLTIPPGVRLSTYSGPDDDDELLRVNNAAFAWHPEQGGWTEADVAERRGESWFDPEGLFLAFDAADRRAARLPLDEGARIHSGGQERSDSGNGLGEVYIVGVDPAAQGRGIGATLTLVGLASPRGAAVSTTVMLYVEADNSAAVKTYERLGFEVFSADVAYTRR